MIIRTATTNDADGLAVLMEQLASVKSHPDLVKRQIDVISKLPNYRILVAVDDNNQIVGSVMGIICYDLCENCRNFMLIENVIVHKDARGKHIGQDLMKAIRDFAVENECYYTLLVSDSQRTESHKFYTSIGFKENKGFKEFL